MNEEQIARKKQYAGEKHVSMKRRDDHHDRTACRNASGTVFIYTLNNLHQDSNLLPRVMFRLEVIETDSVRDDKKYWRGTYKHDTSCFKLKNTSGVYHGEGLDHDDLEKHGISRYVQYKKLNEEQAEWLEKHFV